MSDTSAKFIVRVENELFAEGDDVTRSFALKVGGKPVRNIRGKPKIYQEDWQGRVELSDSARTNALPTSTTGWFTTGNEKSSVWVENATLAPDGTLTATRWESSKDRSGRPNIKLDAPTYPGTRYCMSLFVHRDQQQYIGFYGLGSSLPGIVFDLYGQNYSIKNTWDGAGIIPVDSDWLLVYGTIENTVESTAYNVLMVGNMGGGQAPHGDPAELDIWGAMLIPGARIPGAYIPTDGAPRTITDYTYSPPTAVVALPDPLPTGSKLYWSGELEFDSDPSLLPPNAVHGIRVVENAMSRIGNVPAPLRSLWNPYTCPMELLPWLAWGLSIDTWKSYWPESVKRERVARALEIQRHKGTVQSIRDIIAAYGGAVQLREWWEHSPPATPHTFDLTLSLGNVQGDEATADYVDDVIDAVNRTKPVRSHFDFTQGLRARARVGVASYARPVTYRRLTFEATSA